MATGTSVQPSPTTEVGQAGDGNPFSGTLVRWMWTFVTVGILVVVVVIGFLIGISSSLASIDAGLGEASSAVRGAGGDVEPLPAHLQRVNSNLGAIDDSLQPLSGQATQIIAGLKSVRGNLARVDASLKDTSGSLGNTSGSLVGTSGSLADTSGSLRDTSGSLVDTSGVLAKVGPSLADTSNVLRGVLGTVGQINGTLEVAQRPESLGTAGIPIRVAIANSVLRPAQADTSNIDARLQDVNRHLENICNSPTVTATGAVFAPGAGC